MKIGFLCAVVVAATPFYSFAEALKCSGGGVVIDGVAKAKPDPYGDTIDVKVTLPGKATRYEHAHPIALKEGVSYVGAMSYDGFADRLRISLGSRSNPGQYPNSKLTVHFTDYVYKQDPSGYWDYSPVDFKQDYDVACTVTPEISLPNVCSKTSQELDQMLLQGAAEKSVDQVNQALSCGANPNAIIENGCSALMLASETNLFDCGVTPKKRDNLIFNRARSIFTSLIDNGAFTVQADQSGRTVLHKLIRNGETKLLQDVVDLAVDLDSQDNAGLSPLMLAASTGFENAVRILVSGGANIELKNLNGQTAYDLGARLNSDTRNLLLAPTVTVTLDGQDNGTCSPQKLEVPAGKAVKLKFTSSKSKMFTLSIPAANVSVMPDAGKTVEKTFKIDKPGTYPFQCGAMGGAQMSGTVVAK